MSEKIIKQTWIKRWKWKRKEIKENGKLVLYENNAKGGKEENRLKEKGNNNKQQDQRLKMNKNERRK